MDTTARAAGRRVLADLEANGGGTYEQGTFLPFEPTSGFAVAIGGIAFKDEEVDVDLIVFAMKAVGGEYMTPYVGTWIDDGTVYVDGVLYFGPERGVQALAAGLCFEQKAIYDFATKESVPC